MRLQESPVSVPRLGKSVRIVLTTRRKALSPKGKFRMGENSSEGIDTATCRPMEAHVVKIRAIASESEAEAVATKTERSKFTRSSSAEGRHLIAGEGTSHATCH